MTLRMLCLINPVAGGKRGRGVLAELRELQAAGLFDGEVLELQPGAAAEQLRSSASFDCVLLGGGDGTIAMTAPHLMGSSARIALLPLGTANDLARETGWAGFLRRPLAELINGIAAARPAPFTLWQIAYGAGFEQRAVFCNYCSFGFDAEVVRRCHSLRRRVLYASRLCGRLVTRAAYCAAGLSCCCRPALGGGVARALDTGDTVDCAAARALLFCNIRAIMGLGTANSVSSGFDRQLELQRMSGLHHYAAMLTRIPRLLPSASAAGGWEVRDMDPAVPLQLDGEPCPGISSGSYRITPAGSVNLLLP